LSYMTDTQNLTSFPVMDLLDSGYLGKNKRDTGQIRVTRGYTSINKFPIRGTLSHSLGN
jgi:hypothetical protein